MKPNVPAAMSSIGNLQTVVRKSVCILYAQDRFLIEKDAAERSIAHRLAIHLSALLPGSLNVDVEFNKMTNDKHEQVKKRLLGLPKRAKRSEDVYPDIIAHSRSDSANNELVIEIKRKTNTHGRKADKIKLEEFTKPSEQDGLGYRLGCFIEIGANRAQVIWYENGRQSGKPERIEPD